MSSALIKKEGDFSIYAKYGERRLIDPNAPLPHAKDAQMWYLGKRRIIILQRNKKGERYPYCIIHVHSGSEVIPMSRRVVYFTQAEKADIYATKLVKR